MTIFLGEHYGLISTALSLLALVLIVVIRRARPRLTMADSRLLSLVMVAALLFPVVSGALQMFHPPIEEVQSGFRIALTAIRVFVAVGLVRVWLGMR